MDELSLSELKKLSRHMYDSYGNIIGNGVLIKDIETKYYNDGSKYLDTSNYYNLSTRNY